MKSWNVYTTYYRTRSIFRIDPLDNTVLIMKGISIDEIKATTGFCRTSVSHTNAEDHLHFAGWFYGRKYLHSPRPTFGQAIEHEFFRYIMSSANPSVFLSDLRNYLEIMGAANFKAFKNFPQHAGRSDGLDEETKRAWRSLQASCKIEQSSTRNLREVHTTIIDFFESRVMRLFDATNGYKDCCFGDAQMDDMVYLVSGVECTLLIRSAGSMSRLVTISYLSRVKRMTGDWHWAWSEELYRLREEDHHVSNGEIPHPKKAHSLNLTRRKS